MLMVVVIKMFIKAPEEVRKEVCEYFYKEKTKKEEMIFFYKEKGLKGRDEYVAWL